MGAALACAPQPAQQSGPSSTILRDCRFAMRVTNSERSTTMSGAIAWHRRWQTAITLMSAQHRKCAFSTSLWCAARLFVARLCAFTAWQRLIRLEAKSASEAEEKICYIIAATIVNHKVLSCREACLIKSSVVHFKHHLNLSRSETRGFGDADAFPIKPVV